MDTVFFLLSNPARARGLYHYFHPVTTILNFVRLHYLLFSNIYYMDQTYPFQKYLFFISVVC